MGRRMAKKSAVRAAKSAPVRDSSEQTDDKHPSLLRRGKIDQAEVIRYVTELRVLASRLQSLADEMSRYHLQSVVSDGITQISRGTKTVHRFVTNLEKAIIEAK